MRFCFECNLKCTNTQAQSANHSGLVTVVSMVDGFGYREQALVWWNDADPHSSGLTRHYFGAFWTLPRKHNNFGVSSFIYLLCFSSNEAQERTWIVVFGPKVGQKGRRGGSVSACLSVVTVVWVIIAYSTFEPLPKAALSPWLNFHIFFCILQKVIQSINQSLFVLYQITIKLSQDSLDFLILYYEQKANIKTRSLISSLMSGVLCSI